MGSFRSVEHFLINDQSLICFDKSGEITFQKFLYILEILKKLIFYYLWKNCLNNLYYKLKKTFSAYKITYILAFKIVYFFILQLQFWKKCVFKEVLLWIIKKKFFIKNQKIRIETDRTHDNLPIFYLYKYGMLKFDSLTIKWSNLIKVTQNLINMKMICV
jgi:hypothetical protein